MKKLEYFVQYIDIDYKIRFFGINNRFLNFNNKKNYIKRAKK